MFYAQSTSMVISGRVDNTNVHLYTVITNNTNVHLYTVILCNFTMPSKNTQKVLWNNPTSYTHVRSFSQTFLPIFTHLQHTLSHKHFYQSLLTYTVTQSNTQISSLTKHILTHTNRQLAFSFSQMLLSSHTGRTFENSFVSA